MDVHRSRFVQYPTSPISALAFSRSSDNGYSGLTPDLKLAIGRESGSIEIWNPVRGLWAQETIIHGEKKAVDGLAWTHEPDEKDAEGKTILGQHRLFSIAASPAVIEWDLARGVQKRRSTGNFSELWCFAVQSRWTPHSAKGGEEARSQDIVAGAGDGTLVVLKTEDDDLQFKMVLARVSGKKARCTCITYQNRDVVVAGFGDGTVRVYNTKGAQAIRQMSLGTGLPGRNKVPLVWQVKALPNGDFVSCDSNGEVVFWDGRTYSNTQRFAAHDTDCLDLTVSADGKTIFSGSMDGRMAVFKQAIFNGRKTWTKTSHRRIHDGEVKAMAAYDSKALSVVASGGSDTVPMLTPLRQFGKENVRSLPFLPQDAPVASASKARLLVSWWDNNIYIWRIARQTPEGAASLAPRKLVSKICLDTEEHIQSVSITADGKLLSAATNTSIKALNLSKRSDAEVLAPRMLDLPKGFAELGARLLTFSPDGKWLAAVTPEGEIHLARIIMSGKTLTIVSKTLELERRTHRNPHQSGYKGYSDSIVRITFSPDSSVLVTGDLSGYLDSWILEGHEDLTAPAVDLAKHDSTKASSDLGSDDSDSDSDSDDSDDLIPIFHGQHWAANPSASLTPKLDSSPLVLIFRSSTTSSSFSSSTNGNPGIHATRHNPHAHSHARPTGPYHLFILTQRHQMYEIDVLEGRLSEWSRRNPTAHLPEDFLRIRDRAIGAVWDGGDAAAATTTRQRVWVYGSSWVFMIDLSGDLPVPERSGEEGLSGGRKRRRKGGRRGSRGGAIDVIASAAGPGSKRARILGSGAGGKVEPWLRDGVKSVSVRTELGERVGNVVDEEEEEEESDEDDDGLALTRVRSETGEEAEGEGEAGELVKRVRERPRTWLTFKYRPILGMVLLEDAEGSAKDAEGQGEERPVEVVVVERPLWE